MIYTVTATDPSPEAFTTEHGSFLAYRLKVKDSSGNYEDVILNQKDTTKAPEVDEEIDGELKPGKGGMRLKRTWTGAGTSPGASTGSYTPDPNKDKRITHMHAQKVAVSLLQVKADLKLIDDVSGEDVFKLAHAIRQDVEKVT